MKRTTIFIVFIINSLIINAQAVYVDSNTGNDNNSGTREAPVFSVRRAAEIIKDKGNDIYNIRINPGIYVFDSHVAVSTEKDMTGKRIIIEASILPDDPGWVPEKMPVILSRSLKGEIEGLDHWVVCFLVDESHVTIRGIKFQGYSYPHTRYFPVARINKAKSGLLVEQCLFEGDANVSQIQAGVIAHGNEVMIDHCIFYKLRNTVVFFQDTGNGMKTGNGITNSIIFGAAHAVWTVTPDKDFRFENNIVSDCGYVWAKNGINTGKYAINNCLLVNNKYLTGMTDNERLNPVDFELEESNNITTGKVTLRLTGVNERPFLDEVDKPLPVDYMHPVPGSAGYGMMAGLFKDRKYSEFDRSPEEVGRMIVNDLLSRPEFMMYQTPGVNAVHYAEACAGYGAVKFAGLLHDGSLMEDLISRYDRVEKEKIPNTRNHVDVNVYGILPLEIFMQTGAEKYLEQGIDLADRQWKDTLPGGLTYQTRYWIDDIYMIGCLQVQAYRATGKMIYLERAASEVASYIQRLQQPNGLFYHGLNARFFWGRGNGWVAAGFAELLSVLPESNSQYKLILEGYRKMMKTLADNQADDGMWRQLIDNDKSFKETSSTAMFGFAMATGVGKGLLPKEPYTEAYIKAWNGLSGYVNKDGKIRNVCVGTGQSQDVNFYLTRPTVTGDLHGQAPMLWFASVLLSM